MTTLSSQIEQMKKYLRERVGRMVNIENITAESYQQEFENLFQKCLQLHQKVGQDAEIIGLLAENILSEKTANVTPFTDWFFKDKVFSNREIYDQIFFKNRLKYSDSKLYRHYTEAEKNFLEKDSYCDHKQKESNITSAKYSKAPNKSQADFIVFSMVLNSSELNKVLDHFPSYGDRIEKFGEYYQRGRACTVTWSGASGCNTYVIPWQGLQVGIVIDPNKIDAPNGDMIAKGSYDIIPQETSASRFIPSVKEDSKYIGKPVTLRVFKGKTITNQAKIIKEDRNYQILEEGSIEAFAGNVWRKFFRRGFNQTNEVLCIKRVNASNPVVGLIFDVSEKFNRLNKFFLGFEKEQDRQEIMQIMRRNSHLQLYVYDRRQEEYTVRVVDNQQAIEMIECRQNFTQDFVANLTPFSSLSAYDNKMVKSPDSSLRPEAANNLTKEILKNSSERSA